MKRILLTVVSLLFLTLTPGISSASVVARIDLSQQKMRVIVNGRQTYSWPVSTARRGYRTPTGTYRPKVLKRMHYSSKYHNSPMPHSVFFRGGYAIHGTNAIRRLGRPASHGCVRLHPANARRLYQLIRQHGMRNTQIVIRR
ncbi:L,D-transpeptidase [Rhodobium gokarnense]|uniref:Lipoprotein-anchoring transpeptidase ErfK/SrfK n=1 Tax=Rhodobium gokarnense TaxID=364296 RepID=A0ABT3HFH7_9HYPH|nr:L,D-transpeptidase [Rhodobium gokarnense]MCW2309140.1 lipoprotein-anchoring transpeptidase ErfK/SrfK [Rhodobium gokarnense]